MNAATRAFRETLVQLARESGLSDGMGFFPLDSELRRISSELVVYLASGRALLLQVAHPTVGQGVHDHSNFRTDAIGRGFRTFGSLYLIGFGRQTLAIDVAVKVFEIHQKIKGRYPASDAARRGQKYSAMEKDANAWVLATLIEGTKYAYDQVSPGAMEGERLDRLYRDFLLLGRFFNVKPGDLPPTYAEFAEYFDDMVKHTLAVTPSARKVAKALQGSYKLPYAPGNWLLHVLAAETLPAKTRREFGIRSTAATRAAFKSIRLATKAMHAPPEPMNKLPLNLIPVVRERLDALRPKPRRLRRARA